MNSAVEILRRERDAAAEEAKALRVRIKELDAAIALLGQQPVAPKSQAKAGQDLGTLVLGLLSGPFGTGMVAKEIAAKLTEGDRKTSEASVASTLSRLKGAGKVRNDRGLWFLVDWANPSPSEFDEDDADPLGAYGDDSVIEHSRGGLTDDLDDIAF